MGNTVVHELHLKNLVCKKKVQNFSGACSIYVMRLIGGHHSSVFLNFEVQLFAIFIRKIRWGGSIYAFSNFSFIAAILVNPIHFKMKMVNPDHAWNYIDI